MTGQQVEDFRKYVQNRNGTFFQKMDAVFIFVPNGVNEDYCYLLENAFQKILPSETDKSTYLALLMDYKKENKIYNPVPTIGNDFVKYLWTFHDSLACKLDGEVDVVFEEGQHKPFISPDVSVLSESECKEFNSAWLKFSNSLIRI